MAELRRHRADYGGTRASLASWLDDPSAVRLGLVFCRTAGYGLPPSNLEDILRGECITGGADSGRPRHPSRVGSFRSLRKDGCAGGRRDLERAAELSEAFEARYKGKLADDRGRGRRWRAACRGDRRVRADRGDPGPARQLCRAHPCRRHLRPGAREVLRRPAGSADHDLDPPPVLRAGAEPARRRAARRRRCETPALAHYRPWIEDLRLERPYQLDDTIERLFHEKSVTGRGAWNRLFDETLAALRFDVEGEKLPLEPTLQPPGRSG